jgi:tetratricopeptide (TPR) repeat protein
VAQLTFALNYHFHELNVWGYHLVNLIIHIINALLVFWLVLQILHRLKEKNSIQLKDPEILFVAFSTGLLFAVHPVQTQAVTYIVQRMASLASLFYLLAVNCFLKGRSSIQKRKFAWIWFVLSGLSGLLGLFTKQIVFTFPIMILMLEWILYDDIGSFLKKHKKKAFLTGIIFLLFLLILPLVYKLDFSGIFKTIPPQQGHTYTLTPYNYFLTQLRVHITYLRLIFLPINQHLDYDYPISESLFEWKVILSGLFLLTLFILAVRYRKKYPVFSIGILWYFIASAVESSIIPIPNVIFEHRLYLPICGLLLLLVFMLFKNIINKIIILVLMLSLNVYLTHERNNIWQTEEKIWKESYLFARNKARPNNNYASIIILNNNIFKSYMLFQDALEINPEYTDPKENIYRLYSDIGDYNSFINMQLRSIPIQHHMQYYINRDMNDEAKLYLRSIDIRNINSVNIKYLLYTALFLNDIDIYNKLITISDSLDLLKTEDEILISMMNENKDFSDYCLNVNLISKIKNQEMKAVYLYNKSRQYVLEEDYENAFDFIMDALELDNRPEFYHLRGVIFNNTGNYLYAAMDYTSAFKLSGDPEYVKMRAMCYERMGHEESAKNEWRYYRILREKEGEKGELPE